jgi:glycine dehydrogenase subunit 1
MTVKPLANFLPHTDDTVASMLATCGVATLDNLFADVPSSHYHTQGLVPANHPQANGLDELTLEQELTQLAEQNASSRMACFLGAGAYYRYVPAAVSHIASRSEFYTAYTPYQPEMAQGTLQVTYEFQTMMSSLTGLPVVNASVYDGTNAVTEAVLMAQRINQRPAVVFMEGVHPHAVEATRCYLSPYSDVTLYLNQTDTHRIDAQTSCVVVQTPDYYGTLWQLDALATHCKQQGTLLIVSADPVSLGVLEAPGKQGADIVVDDLQPLGNNLSFGGPYAGYMACQQTYLRQMPGRLVSKTTDATGNPAYCLTLQTREQHIRRQKANSNICTNQALNVLKATAMLTLLGPDGLGRLATLSVQRAHWLANALCQLPGVRLWQPQGRPFFNEFALTLNKPVQPVLDAMAQQHGILAGVPLVADPNAPANALLVAVTEMNPPSQLQAYVMAMAQCLLVPQPEKAVA